MGKRKKRVWVVKDKPEEEENNNSCQTSDWKVVEWLV